MLPFERLRSLARLADDDHLLAEETADCLADFGADVTQLITVCRRLLAHHPRVGPMWWLCCRVVTASDPERAARDAARVLAGDPTAERLARALPFPHDDPIAVAGWSDVLADAVAERTDLDLVETGATRRRATRHRVAHVRRLDLAQLLANPPTHVLVPCSATSPTTALVAEGVTEVLDALPASRLWVVGGAGVLVPDRVLEAAAAAATESAQPFERIAMARVDRYAGVAGPVPPARLAAAVDCPTAPELLRS